MKHILYITPGFADGETDTTCIPALQVFCERMALEKKIKITILALGYPTQEKQYDWNGISVFSCGGKYIKWPLKLIVYYKAIQKIKKINAIQKIDIVHSFWYHDASVIGGYIASKYGCKQIITIMGQDALHSNKFIPLLKNTKATTITLSAYQNKIFEKNTNRNSQIIPWGINPKEFLNEDIKSIEFDVLGVGSLTKLKQFDHFINVVKELKKEFSNIKFGIIGDGEEKLNLENLSKNNGLEKNIKFLDSMVRKDVLNYMQKSRILLHTSSYESFGYVLVEALAAGMQVVSYPVGIAKELPHTKIGTTTDKLSEHIKNILLEQNLRQKNIPFKIEDTCAAYLQLYSNLTQ